MISRTLLAAGSRSKMQRRSPRKDSNTASSRGRALLDAAAGLPYLLTATLGFVHLKVKRPHSRTGPTMQAGAQDSPSPPPPLRKRGEGDSGQSTFPALLRVESLVAGGS